MASINQLVQQQIFTHEGGKAIPVSPLQQLRRSVLSCLLWENEAYEDGKSIAERITETCKQLPAEKIAEIAIEAKQEMRLRHVPLLLTTILCQTKDGREQLSRVVPQVVTRVDDITELLAIYWRSGKKPLAKQLKKHLGAAFCKFDEHQLAKYNGGFKAVRLKDVIKLCRPKPRNPEQAALWGRLVRDELKTPDTWEVAISATTDKKTEWERLIKEKKLGGLATLRNIRNFTKCGVDRDLVKSAIDNINPGKLLPINFIAAAIHNPSYESQLEEKFYSCFSQNEKIKKETIVLVDVSGSMDDALSARSELKRIDVACSLAIIAREMFEDVRVFTFSNELIEVPNRHGFALRDTIIRSQRHGATKLAQSLKQLPKTERLIVITDEQASDNVTQPDVEKPYLINVASAKNGIGYRKWVHIDGWSDKVLSFIQEYENN